MGLMSWVLGPGTYSRKTQQMKNLFNKIGGMLFLAGAMSLVSCDDSDEHKSLDKLAINLNQTIPDTVLFGQQLKMDVVANQAQTFTLTLSPQDKPAEPVYDSTFTNPGGRFLYATEVTVPRDGSWTGDYLIKVAAGNVEDTKKVYFKKPSVIDYYLVGGSSAAGWTPENGLQLKYYTKTDAGVKTEWYETYGYFTVAGDGLKLLPSNTGWTGDAGADKNAAGKLTINDEANIVVPADGFYRLKVTLKDGDIEGGSYVLAPSRWGIIGDATPGGWGEDTDMSFAPGKGKYEWTVTLPLEGGKKIKFRENDSWDNNLGAAGSGPELKDGGADIAVETSGNYTVTLNLAPAGYTYTIKKN